jgi:hypothetical protein
VAATVPIAEPQAEQNLAAIGFSTPQEEQKTVVRVVIDHLPSSPAGCPGRDEGVSPSGTHHCLLTADAVRG